MNKNTSISLGSHFDSFIQKSITDGRFKNVSQIIRAGLRLLEEDENKFIALRQSLNEGIDRGIFRDFDPTAHLETLKADRKQNG